MEITEVRIKLVQNGGNERLRAFCSITLDGDFVIRDLKVIDGSNGPFVAMPSRKLMDRCQRCGSKNHLRARFCNECGNKLNESRAPKDAQGRAKLHADVAHPINAACRERVQAAVVEAYQAEIERAKAPDYKPSSFDDFEDFEEEAPAAEASESAVPPAAKQRPAPAPAEPRRPAPAEEPAKVDKGDDDAFGDYNALIADLKRDAQQRRPESRGERGAGYSQEASPARGAPGDMSEPTRRPEPRPVADRPPQPAPASPPPPPATTSPTPQPASSGPAPQSSDEFGEGL
jgi:stage V sporulation protein G